MHDLRIRLATPDDIPPLNDLIERSARELSRGFYTDREAESAIRYMFGVDAALIADGTYFLAELGDLTAGCGGWSYRRALYGRDQPSRQPAEVLDPAREPARIRAFFVAPEAARRGVGRGILEACIAGAAARGYRSLELMATLPGVPFYSANGFVEVEHVVISLPDGVPLPFIRMRRELQ